jgi:ABC-type transport system substrate-binding protein
MKDWKNSIGTGAFMLTEYVPGSALSYQKNPNYWGTNPAGPGKGDKLPYVDELKQLIIEDSSTQLAAVRTGKVDFSLWTDLTLDDTLALMDQRPELKKQDNQREDNHPYFRLDKDLPFNDIKVRRRLPDD